MQYILLIIFILSMTACGASDASIDTTIPSAANNIVLSAIEGGSLTTVSIQDQNVKNTIISDNTYPIYDSEIGLFPWDFDVAYQICIDAISDYYMYTDSDMGKYIENNQLQEYIKMCAEWDSDKRHVSKIGISKAEFCEDDTNDLKWFYFNIFITFSDGGAVTEFIVKESLDRDSIVIADWYIQGNLPLDDQTREVADHISDPSIWENTIFADEMIRKAQEILDRRTTD